VEYFLDESNNWSLTVGELKRAYNAGVAAGKTIRALAVINPGNPTGSLLSFQQMREVLQFCQEHKIALLADEVYQENIYGDDDKFHSFKKVACDVGAKIPVISFHSVSKGVFGECGKRGGYMELYNVDPMVKAELYKLSSVRLCPNVDGQLMVALMADPPLPGDASHASHVKEVDDIFESLKRRALIVERALNALEGVSCNPCKSSMYAFPQITLPAKAIAAAKEKGQAPDLMYAMELLEGIGMVVVPGSGFGQVEGTYHFRTTFLPPESKIEAVMELFAGFHKGFLEKYKGD